MVNIGDEIVIVVYSHGHGIDPIPCVSDDGAHDVAIEIVQQWRGDFDIDEGLSDDEVLKDWFELTNGRENIEFDKRKLNP